MPESAAGDAMGQLKTKRAQILGMDNVANMTVLTVHAPLAEMQRYATDLRSITGGRGFYEMHYDHYAPVPPNLMQPIVTKHKAEMAGKVEEE